MGAMNCALLLATVMFAQGGQATPQKPEPKWEMKTFQFVMLKKGKATGLTEAEEGKRQQAHLAYLEKLVMKDDKAVLVGPLTDNGDIRGIIVLNTSAEEAKAIVAADPWASTGALVADIRPLMAADKVMQKPPKFMDLVPYTVGFYKRAKGDLPKLSEDEGKRLQAAHLANNEKMWKAGYLTWAGPFLDNTELRGLLIFNTVDRKKLEAMLNEDPLVKAGRLVYELHPGMTSKGVFAGPGEKH
jgi:uncharacterized protein YciI